VQSFALYFLLLKGEEDALTTTESIFELKQSLQWWLAVVFPRIFEDVHY
jgi:hypothetical protein